MSRYRRILIVPLLALAAAGVEASSAAYTSASQNRGTTLGAKADWAAPVAGASVIAKTAGGSGGSIKPGATYYVYANVTDSGNPSAGISTVTANVSSLTTGQTAVPLTAGAYTVDGTAHTHRGGPLTAGSTLAAGSYSYTLALADGAGNTASRTGLNVTVDAAAPTATDVQTRNLTGGTAGKAEAGDSVTFTFSELIDPITILAGWSGAATAVVVRITDGGTGNDTLTVRNAANATQLALGSVNLGRKDFVTATRDFGATGTTSQMTQSAGAVSVTLGTASGATTLAAGTGSMIWTPSTAATDRAGNAAAATAATETGTADLDF